MTAAPPEPEPEPGPEPVATPTDRRWVLTAVLLALALAMVAGGGVLLQRAHALRSVTAADNHALVDTSATADVQKQVSTALTRILTFDHSRPDQTRTAAEQVLAGKAEKQYDQLFAVLLQQAGSQQLTLKTKVDVVGVKRLTAGSADLLVFLDQSSTSATDGQSRIAAAQLDVSAVREGGRWLITDLDPL